MRQITKILALALVALFFAGSAWASPTLGSGYNFITFTNYENRIPIQGTNELVLPGDIFYGIATISMIDFAATDIQEDWLPTSNTQYLQGYFYTQVKTITPISGEQVQIVFETPSFLNENDELAYISDPFGVISDDELAQGVVLKWFESNTPLNYSSLGSSITSATDGSLWMSLSIQDGYWWSVANPSTAGLAPGDFIGTSYYGLNLVDGSVKYLLDINDPLETLFDYDVNFYGQAKLFASDPNNAAGKVWEFYSSDPAVVATPEPTTLLLLGAGLLGLGAVARRRRN